MPVFRVQLARLRAAYLSRASGSQWQVVQRFVPGVAHQTIRTPSEDVSSTAALPAPRHRQCTASRGSPTGPVDHGPQRRSVPDIRARFKESAPALRPSPSTAVLHVVLDTARESALACPGLPGSCTASRCNAKENRTQCSAGVALLCLSLAFCALHRGPHRMHSAPADGQRHYPPITARAHKFRSPQQVHCCSLLLLSHRPRVHTATNPAALQT